MNDPRYFVLVFGDPTQNGDTVESGQYESGDGYPPFTVEPGDLLLLYCTEGYAKFSKQFPGIGVAVRTNPRQITYRRIPFASPLPLRLIDDDFLPDDRKKMGELRFNRRRAFEISKQSFARIAAKSSLALD